MSSRFKGPPQGVIQQTPFYERHPKLFEALSKIYQQDSGIPVSCKSERSTVICKHRDCFFERHPRYKLKTIAKIAQAIEADGIVLDAFHSQNEFFHRIKEQIDLYLLPFDTKRVQFLETDKNFMHLAINNILREYKEFSQFEDNFLLELIFEVTMANGSILHNIVDVSERPGRHAQKIRSKFPREDNTRLHSIPPITQNPNPLLDTIVIDPTLQEVTQSNPIPSTIQVSNLFGPSPIYSKFSSGDKKVKLNSATSTAQKPNLLLDPDVIDSTLDAILFNTNLVNFELFNLNHVDSELRHSKFQDLKLQDYDFLDTNLTIPNPINSNISTHELDPDVLESNLGFFELPEPAEPTDPDLLDSWDVINSDLFRPDLFDHNLLNRDLLDSDLVDLDSFDPDLHGPNLLDCYQVQDSKTTGLDKKHGQRLCCIPKCKNLAIGFLKEMHSDTFIKRCIACYKTYLQRKMEVVKQVEKEARDRGKQATEGAEGEGEQEEEEEEEEENEEREKKEKITMPPRDNGACENPRTKKMSPTYGDRYKSRNVYLEEHIGNKRSLKRKREELCYNPNCNNPWTQERALFDGPLILCDSCLTETQEKRRKEEDNRFCSSLCCENLQSESKMMFVG